MNSEEFVSNFTHRVYRSAIDSAITGLQGPAGRRPARDLVLASRWYLELEESDQRMVRWIIADAAHAASYGVLALIDGARPTGPQRYELAAMAHDGTRHVVNQEGEEDLHDIFQGLVMGEDGTLIDA